MTPLAPPMRPWIRTIDSPAPASGLNHGHDQTIRSGGSGLLRRTGSFGTGWGSRRVVGPRGSGGGSTGRRELWAGWRGGTKGGSAGPFDRPGGNYRGEDGSVAVGGGARGRADRLRQAHAAFWGTELDRQSIEDRCNVGCTGTAANRLAHVPVGDSRQKSHSYAHKPAIEFDGTIVISIM